MNHDLPLQMGRDEIKGMYDDWMVWARLVGLSLQLGDGRSAVALAKAAMLYAAASTMSLGIQYGPRVAP